MTLDEDACRIRKGDAPQNLAALRNAIISLLRLEDHNNIAGGLRACTWRTQPLLTKLGIVKKCAALTEQSAGWTIQSIAEACVGQEHPSCKL